MADVIRALAPEPQDTGNPVLDSTVNIVRAMQWNALEYYEQSLRSIHAVILELAAEEPGGLRVRGKDGMIASVERGAPAERRSLQELSEEAQKRRIRTRTP